MASNFDDLYGEKPIAEVKKEEREQPKEETKQAHNRNTTQRKEKNLPELHVLTEENVLIFVKQVNRTKKYELKHRFYNSSSLEISEMIDKLLKEEKLQRFDYGWIGIKENK